MKMRLKNLLIVLVLVISNVDTTFAGGPGPPPPFGPGGGPPTPDDLPIDSEIFILVFAALALGFYIISRRRKIST